uniref:Uncharacterized protein n=1 Tax=Aegilops tauschii TaxID=37682 RepID=R7WGP0_AEGTA
MASKSRQVPTVVALVRQSAASERCRSQVLGMSPRLTKMPRLQVLGMSPRRPTSSTSSVSLARCKSCQLLWLLVTGGQVNASPGGDVEGDLRVPKMPDSNGNGMHHKEDDGLFTDSGPVLPDSWSWPCARYRPPSSTSTTYCYCCCRLVYARWLIHQCLFATA